MKALEHINLLGLKAKDKVTEFEGTIDSICFDPADKQMKS